MTDQQHPEYVAGLRAAQVEERVARSIWPEIGSDYTYDEAVARRDGTVNDSDATPEHHASCLRYAHDLAKAAILALIDQAPEPVPQGVAVLPLEWKHQPKKEGSYVLESWEADLGYGIAVVEYDPDEDEDFAYSAIMHDDAEHFGSLEEAKDFFASDRERVILSALTTAPVTTAEVDPYQRAMAAALDIPITTPGRRELLSAIAKARALAAEEPKT